LKSKLAKKQSLQKFELAFSVRNVTKQTFGKEKPENKMQTRNN